MENATLTPRKVLIRFRYTVLADGAREECPLAVTSRCCAGGTYCPDANVMRAEMPAFLVRAFRLP